MPGRKLGTARVRGGGVKIRRIWAILWMKEVETKGKARSTQGKANPWIKSNKLHHTNKSQKQFGAIFVGNFQIRDKISKTRLENTTGRLRNHDQCGSRYQDDIGWNPRWLIFLESSNEHDEHEGKHEGKTQENHSNQQD